MLYGHKLYTFHFVSARYMALFKCVAAYNALNCGWVFVYIWSPRAAAGLFSIKNNGKRALMGSLRSRMSVVYMRCVACSGWLYYILVCIYVLYSHRMTEIIV